MLLTYLCTYDEHLPQGAPTSAYISNLVLKDFDEEIGYWCEQHNIAYTRYSDDMTFSGNFNPSDLIKKVRKMLYKLGLELNNEKIHFINNSNRQVVTGIVVNERLAIEKTYKKKIRQEMYYIKKYGIKSHLCRIGCNDKDKYIASLKGKILYVLQIDKSNGEFINYKNIINKLI